MDQIYPLLKALHIVGVVAWFAALFYIVRLFVYLSETRDRPAAERAILEPQLQLMADRLWSIIGWPAGVFAVACGLGLLYFFWPVPPWLHVKLGLVGLLIGYHLACQHYLVRFRRGQPTPGSTFFRLWNEGATLLLVAIVFVVVFKRALGALWGVGGLLALAAALTAGVALYRKARLRYSRNESHH